jgi:PIN domain nuclease of toxin-antitoxin system
VWYLEGNVRLGARARAVLSDPDSRLVLPVIVLAEACWMVEHGKADISSVTALLATVDSDARNTIYPLDRSVLDRSVSLTAVGEMHDRQIVATALQIADSGDSVALITKDENIRSAGLVPVIW